MRVTVNVLGVNVPWLRRKPWYALWVLRSHRDSHGNLIGDGVNVTFLDTVAEARAWGKAFSARRIGTVIYDPVRSDRVSADIAACIRAPGQTIRQNTPENVARVRRAFRRVGVDLLFLRAEIAGAGCRMLVGPGIYVYVCLTECVQMTLERSKALSNRLSQPVPLRIVLRSRSPRGAYLSDTEGRYPASARVRTASRESRRRSGRSGSAPSQRRSRPTPAN